MTKVIILWPEVLPKLWSEMAPRCQEALPTDSFFADWLENRDNCHWIHSTAPKEFLLALHSALPSKKWCKWQRVILERGCIDVATKLLREETQELGITQWLKACARCRCLTLFPLIVEKLREGSEQIYCDFLTRVRDPKDLCCLLRVSLDHDIYPSSKDEIIDLVDKLVLLGDNCGGLLEEILSRCGNVRHQVTVWNFLRDEFLSASFLLTLAELGFDITLRNENNEDISASLETAKDLQELVTAGIILYLGDNNTGFNPADVCSEDGRWDLACELIHQGCATKSPLEEKTFLCNVLQSIRH